jgi:beta-lactam-binding protein with PASTA domain
VPVTGLTIDSRVVVPGTLFVALRGRQTDGHRFVADAVRRGAAASGGQRELPDIVQAMEETVRVPDLRGLATAAAVERLDRCGLRATVVHQNAQVLVQEPRPGATVRPGTAVALYGEAGLAEHVPDVTGLTLREAMRELRPTGLEIKALGSGVIVEQTPLAGSPLPAQGTCRLVLASR